MHEHLDNFALINMNGRVYDPLIARFLSPDPQLQAPGNWLNYNRYTYCLNNPLIYTDPSGEFWHLVIGAAIGGTINWLANGAEFCWEGLGYFGIGALAGAVGAGVGSGMMAAQAGSSFGAGFIGTQSAMTAISTSYTTSFLSGAAIGGLSSFSSSFISGAGNAWMGGDNFGEGLWNGFQKGVVSGIKGAAIGGLLGGLDATGDNRKFWSGDRKYNEFGRPIPRAGNVREEAEEFVHRLNDELEGKVIGSPQEWKLEYDLENIDVYGVQTRNGWKYVDYDANVSWFVKYNNIVDSQKSFLELQNEVFDNISFHNYLSFKHLFGLYRKTFYK
jgi:RHS repeat-associated protein